MTIGVFIKSKSGCVLATDSRTTTTIEIVPGKQIIGLQNDKGIKLFSFKSPHNFIGAINYGLATIGAKFAHDLVPEFEATLPSGFLTVNEFAQHFSSFLLQQWQAEMPADFTGPNMSFVVGGYHNFKDRPFGGVFSFDIPDNPAPMEKPFDIIDIQGKETFGIILLGERYFIDRLIQGYDCGLPEILSKIPDLQANQVGEILQAFQKLRKHIPIIRMSIKQCEELAKFFIRTTIDAQSYTDVAKTCGDPIVSAIISRLEKEGFKFISPPQ